MDNNETIIITGATRDEKSGAKIIFLILSILSFIYALITIIFGATTHTHIDLVRGFLFLAVGVVFVYFYKYKKPLYEITVTNKRIIGKTPSGKQVELPLNSISAVAKASSNTIAVSTSSGRIAFKGIENSEQIFTEINKLLAERQETRSTPTVVNQQIAQSVADELKKFKELYDSGVITQQEFEEKKRQLLGL
ncbi:MAG: SHOCT domain-containing protein [Lachnospiraceae bacterium]|nr:SHOCT domain-containing protein [Ruminococcus sp.]MCM1274811.1 SHOCT domain-containing protein [Lachnospiraceae bacterium]